jgi:regulation of enolase protein 1 (concanavalin A-like superfamily)
MRKLLLGLLILIVASSSKAGVLFQEPFEKTLKPGWFWIREDPAAWRLRDAALEIRVQPGNMWGPENNAKNVLVRPLPRIDKGDLIISVTVENKPSHQYEQVDLVCYFDDSHMVKIGQELVDGKLSIVMGREEKDRTRTLAIIPIDKTRVDLRFSIRGSQATGQYRPGATGDWMTAGKCDLPVNGELKIAIQCYQGPPDREHWSKIQNFRIEQASF